MMGPLFIRLYLHEDDAVGHGTVLLGHDLDDQAADADQEPVDQAQSGRGCKTHPEKTAKFGGAMQAGTTS